MLPSNLELLKHIADEISFELRQQKTSLKRLL